MTRQLGRYLRHGWHWFLLIQLICLLGLLLAGWLLLGDRMQSRAETIVTATESYLQRGGEALQRLSAELPPGICNDATAARLTDAAIRSGTFDHFAYLSDADGYCRSAANPIAPARVDRLIRQHPGPLRFGFDNSSGSPHHLFLLEFRPGHHLVGVTKSAHLLERLLDHDYREFAGRLEVKVDHKWFYQQDRLQEVPWLGQAHTLERGRVSVDIAAGPPRVDGRWLLASLALALLLGLGGPVLLLHRRSHHGILPEDLAGALRRGEFTPVFQPIVDGCSGEVQGFEMMARWRHPSLGTISPDAFIPLMERHRLLDRLLLTLADQARGRLPESAYLSINLSGDQLTRRLRDPVSFLLAICRRLRMPASRLMVEITERHALDYDCPQLQETLTLLRRSGFKLAFDDFGTGHNGIASLKSFAPDVIKIDRSYLHTVNGDASHKPLLDAIIQLARRMQVDVIAEGVETQAQRRFLLERGVSNMQGFLFGKPVRWSDRAPQPHPATA